MFARLLLAGAVLAEAAVDKNTWPQYPSVCSDPLQGSLFYALRHIGLQGRKQEVVGPIQDDEALLLFSLARTAGVNRALELGGLGGFSARTMLEAVQCSKKPAVYTIDVSPVHRLGPLHQPIQKSAADVTVEDLGGAPFDLMMLDCHHFPATKKFLVNVLKWGLLNPDGMLFLHDTGSHPRPGRNASLPGRGVIHQPVERLIVQWLERYDCTSSWQRLVVHDDHARGATPFRHGVTVLQRKVSLAIPTQMCRMGSYGLGGVGPRTVQECTHVQAPETMCPRGLTRDRFDGQ